MKISLAQKKSSSKEPDSVADVVMKISIEAAKRTQSKEESESKQKPKSGNH